MTYLCPSQQPFDPLSVSSPSRQQDHWSEPETLVRPDSRQQRKSVHVWHLNVRQDQVGFVFTSLGKANDSVSSLNDLGNVRLEQGSEVCPKVSRVIDDEDNVALVEEL